MKEVKETDWKEYKRNVDRWRDRYLDGILAEIAELLTAPNVPPLERFQSAYQRFDKTAEFIDDTFGDFRRSTMERNLISYLVRDIIEESELDGFSEEERSYVLSASRWLKEQEK